MWPQVFPANTLLITAATAYRNHRSEDLQREYDAGQTVELGDHLWFEYGRGLIIPVTVVELDEVVIPTPEVCEKYQLDPKAGLWVSVEDGTSGRGRPPGAYAVGSHATEKSEGGWPKSVEVDPVDLADSTWVNQEFWIDEVLGHATKFDYDNIARDFREVWRNANTLDRRQALRRHKKLQSLRESYSGFVNGTHIRAGFPPGCPVVTTPKPVYVKTGVHA